MNWESDALRAVVLRLLMLGQVRATRQAAPLFVELEELGLVVPTSRAAYYRRRPGKAAALREYVAQRWDGLAAAELAFSCHPWTISAAALRGARRARLTLPAGLQRLNRKTWSAWAGAHSKSGHVTAPHGMVLTADETVRVRPNRGLRMAMAEPCVELPLDALQAFLGEVAIPERGFGHAWRLDGVMPELIVTVENRGAFVDFPSVDGLLVVHAPGRNTALATRFISALPANIPWVHFPDLDPAGLDIALSLHCGEPPRRPLTWIPRAAAGVLASHALPLDAPWQTDGWPRHLLDDPVLAWLIRKQCWLEQEGLVLLPRFLDELIQLPQRCTVDCQSS